MQEIFEKIIEKLKQKSIFMTTCDGYGANCVSVGTIEEIIKQEAEKFGTDTNVGSNRWIPCSERLPEDHYHSLISRRESNMRAVKDDAGKASIVMDDEEEYLLNTQRCARCQHSFQCKGDFRFYCHWREDCYCIGDWADCSGYQPKGE